MARQDEDPGVVTQRLRDRSDFEYRTGTLMTNGGSTRVYLSDDGLIGKVVRRGALNSAPRVKFFVWGLPDSAPEYPNEEAARDALND